MSIASKKRLFVNALILFFIALSFWSFSRYPDLYYEAERAERGILTSRTLGGITKDELITTNTTEGKNSPSAILTTIGKTTLEWLYTNKEGMAFGIVFGGAFLALLLPFTTTKKYFAMKGLRGSLVGTLMGAPLGICANCVAPIGAAMKKKGMSLETTLSAMVASPNLNIVGIFIVLAVFPLNP